MQHGLLAYDLASSYLCAPGRTRERVRRAVATWSGWRSASHW